MRIIPTCIDADAFPQVRRPNDGVVQIRHADLWHHKPDFEIAQDVLLDAACRQWSCI